MVAMTKEEKEWFHALQKQEYEYAKADGLEWTELKLKVKSYALGLVRHIIDMGGTPKATLDQIKLALRSEEIISGWIDGTK